MWGRRCCGSVSSCGSVSIRTQKSNQIVVFERFYQGCVCLDDVTVCRVDIARARHDDGWSTVPPLATEADQFFTGGRHVKIRQNQIDVLTPQRFERRRAIVERQHIVPVLLQERSQIAANEILVVDEQNKSHR